MALVGDQRVRAARAARAAAEFSTTPTCDLYDGASNYRLGDVTGSRFFRHTAGGLHYHVTHFPRSLATKFLHTFGHGTGAAFAAA